MINRNYDFTTAAALRVKQAFMFTGTLVLSLLLLTATSPLALAQQPDKPAREEFALNVVADNRTEADTSKFPFSAIVKLKVTFPDGTTGWGTGALIGPDKVVTAEHVVYSERHGGHASTMEVLPGYSDGTTVCRRTKVKGFSHGTHQGCHNGAKCDVAVLTLEDSIGCNTGWFGMKRFSEADLSDVYIAGYPSDRGDGETMYFVRTEVTRSEDSRHNILEYLEWTAGGMSGGPIFTTDYYIVGIHTNGGPSANYGVGFCEQLLASLREWKDR